MKLLADESLEMGIVLSLRGTGHDVRAIIEELPRASDREVLRAAVRDKRILITNDKDFAELTFLQRKAAPGIVLLRMPWLSTHQKGARLLEALGEHEHGFRGVMTVVEESALRRRPFPRKKK